MSLHFFTNEIIHLQAIQPLIKAAIKPTIKALTDTGWVIPCSAKYSALGARICFASRSASPKIGGITIKNENCARFLRLFPNNKPVAMVDPLRDRPGKTAQA